MINTEQLNAFIEQVIKLHSRHEYAETIRPDTYEPGMMEYPEKSDGLYDPETGCFTLFFESRGTRYDGRTEQIEKVQSGDVIIIRRDSENQYNSNNFRLFTSNDKDVGNMPAELCNAIAPLFDSGMLQFDESFVSFADPISKRPRHAKQAVLFVKLCGHLVL